MTIQKDAIREAFDIGALKEKNANELAELLEEHGMCIFPHPYHGRNVFRIYDLDHEVGQLALAVTRPDDVLEKALADVARLYDRERARNNLRSDDVPWLQAFDVFLQVLIGRTPEGWEDLRDDRHPRQLATELAASLGLPEGVPGDHANVRLAGAVCALRPRASRWEGPPSTLSDALVDADRKQKALFERVLVEAAKYLLGTDEFPTQSVELGVIGLRYCREAR